MPLYKERSWRGRTALPRQQQPGAALPSTLTPRPLLLNSTKNCSSAGISNGNSSEILLFRHGNPDTDIPEDSESRRVLGASPTPLRSRDYPLLHSAPRCRAQGACCGQGAPLTLTAAGPARKWSPSTARFSCSSVLSAAGNRTEGQGKAVNERWKRSCL